MMGLRESDDKGRYLDDLNHLQVIAYYLRSRQPLQALPYLAYILGLIGWGIYVISQGNWGGVYFIVLACMLMSGFFMRLVVGLAVIAMMVCMSLGFLYWGIRDGSIFLIVTGGGLTIWMGKELIEAVYEYFTTTDEERNPWKEKDEPS